MKDMGVLGFGNLMGGASGQTSAEAGRPDRHSRLQRVQRLRDRSHRPAGRGDGGQVRRGGLRPGRRGGEAGRSRAPRRRQSCRRLEHLDPAGSPGRGRRAGRPGRDRHHARRVRSDRHGVRAQVRRDGLRAVRQDQREEPLSLHAQPDGRLPEEDDARGDHERRHDRLPEHPTRCALPTATERPRR